MAVIYIVTRSGIVEHTASDRPMPFANSPGLTGNGFMRHSSAFIGWTDERILKAYASAERKIDKLAPVDYAFREYRGGALLPCHMGGELVLGSRLSAGRLEQLRLLLAESGCFDWISPCYLSPTWISARIRPVSEPLYITPQTWGTEVFALQKLLICSGFFCTLNGRFDRGTERALRRFKSELRLPVSDFVDEAVWRALKERASLSWRLRPPL